MTPPSASAADLLQGMPPWISEELVAETRAVWEPFYGRSLTRDETLEILLSVGRLLDAFEEKMP